MTKRFSVFLTALFCAFIGGVCAISILLPKKEFSELENRYLKKFPKVTVEQIASGKLMENLADYTADHIVGRDLWVALQAWCERLSGKQENNNIYFGKHETLLNRLDPPAPEKLEQAAGYVNAFAENLDIPVYFGLIPSSAAIWADRLPKGAPTADEQAIIADFYAELNCQTVNLYDALWQRRDRDLYYRTDHHWTSLGAYYGYASLMESMGLEPVPLDSLSPVTVAEDFNGTSFSGSGVRWLTPDSIQTYVPDDGLEVISYFTGQPEQGSLYVEENLAKKDKYSYFLGGNQPLCVIKTQNTDAPKLLLVRDSYSDSLAPFLTRNFSEIHLFDLRYNKNSLKNYVQQNGIDCAAALYSISNFVSSQDLFLLGM